ncbi:hypothetical protein CHARACLAT_031573 [Characodon lateralis]|uniref:SDE2/SF3A3 SAP domain-containing protein n=1 Tax=Characodon lateralis TaxID=208331 RepID=A0ABU7EP06_9TELE|nr:hypothetical protein [Characodon lateralis]
MGNLPSQYHTQRWSWTISSRAAALPSSLDCEQLSKNSTHSSDCSSSSAGPTLATSEDQKPGPPTEPVVEPPEDQEHPAPTSKEPQQLDLSSVTSVQQLESLGLGILKEELMRRGLKCGGTLLERAARLFSVRGQSPDQIDPTLLAKPKK